MDLTNGKYLFFGHARYPLKQIIKFRAARAHKSQSKQHLRAPLFGGGGVPENRELIARVIMDDWAIGRLGIKRNSASQPKSYFSEK